MNLQVWLENNNFKKCTELGLKEENLDYISDRPNQDDYPCVYLWASADLQSALYVGKAGRGIRRRLDQHIGGFNHAKKETRKKKLMLDFLKNNEGFDVYFRPSNSTVIFGHDVTLNSAEEHALYLEFMPEWNIAGFAESKTRAEESDAKLPDPIEKYISENDLPFDFEDLPYSDDAHNFWSSLSTENKKKFLEIFNALDQLGFMKDLNCRLVGGYSKLAPNYNGKTTIVFGLLANKRLKNESWCAKIPLALNPTLFFPKSIFYQNKIRIEHNGNVEPADIGDFCKNPQSYIDLSKLERRIQEAAE